METRVRLRIVLLFSALPVLVVWFPGTRAAFYSGNKPGDTMAHAPWDATPTDSLKRTILSGYDKFSRPSHYQNTTNVTMGLYVYHVGLDDANSVMELHSWIKLAWKDDKLKWTPSDYGGLTSLHVAYHEIWQPDVRLYNSASGNTNQYDHTHCIVFSNGAVMWVPSSRLVAFCDLELKHWPQDEHTCNFTFGSWTYYDAEINLMNEPQIDFGNLKAEVYVENAEWELVDLKPHRRLKFYKCCVEPYLQVDYVVTIQRRGVGRAGVLRAQAAAAILVSLLAHMLPVSSSVAPRALLATAPPTLLALALFYLKENLPASHSSVDIVSLYTASLALVLTSAMMSAVVLNIARARGTPPSLLKRAIASRVAHFFGAPEALDYTSEDLQPAGTVKSGNLATSSRAWSFLATLLDRVTALALFFTFILLMVTYS